MNKELTIAKSKKVKTFAIDSYDKENSFFAVAWKAGIDELVKEMVK